MPATTINREWIAAEFSKGIEAEASSVMRSRRLLESPPELSELAPLYHEMAEADTRHARAVEVIAIRHGYTPTESIVDGFKGLLERVKALVPGAELEAHRQVAADLRDKADSVHWYTAWVAAFEELGDRQSVEELAEILREEASHRDRLQEALNRLVIRGATQGPARRRSG